MKFILFFILIIFANAQVDGIITNVNELFKTITVNKMQYKIIKLSKLEQENCINNNNKKIIKFKDLKIGDLVEGTLNYNQGLSSISYLLVKCDKELAF